MSATPILRRPPKPPLAAEGYAESPVVALRSFSEGERSRADAKRYVYLLRSESHEKQTYVGLTTDFPKRLKQHNAGESPYTARFRPWKPVVVLRFDDDQKAEQFERYLKSGSGHAFAKRHLW